MASAKVGMAVVGDRNVIVVAERKGRVGRGGQDEGKAWSCAVTSLLFKQAHLLVWPGLSLQLEKQR